MLDNRKFGQVSASNGAVCVLTMLVQQGMLKPTWCVQADSGSKFQRAKESKTAA